MLGKTENLLCVSRLVVHFDDEKECGASIGSHLGIRGWGAIVHQNFSVDLVAAVEVLHLHRA